MADTSIRPNERVLVTRHSPVPGAPPLTGTAVGRWLTQSGEPIYTIVLDAPTADGLAIIDCPESQLIVLPAI